MTSYLAGPSLGAATNTRVDSAAKHIQQCRVSEDHMLEFVTFDGQCDGNELVQNETRYCVHKDELVVGIARSWTAVKRFANTAYPRVISNLGRLPDGDSFNDAIKMYIYMYHNAISVKSRDKLIEMFKDRQKSTVDEVMQGSESPNAYFTSSADSRDVFDFTKYLHCMYDFVPVGYANTVGFAHSQSGDTMTSVHIGGLRTVQNGHFEVFCGDVLQWYWPFEQQCFDKNGKRKPLTIDLGGEFKDGIPPYLNKCPYENKSKWTNSSDAQSRREYFDRQYGQTKKTEKHVAMIKPYRHDDEHPRIYDWYRVFAVAISSSRPFEALDIRISRQAI